METFRMVEDSIKNADDYPTESELWRSLPKRIPRTYLKRILHRLRLEGKIMYGKGRRIIWTEADELQSKIIREQFKVVS
jgi:hypothetical protein